VCRAFLLLLIPWKIRRRYGHVFSMSIIREIQSSRVLILGCGNKLLGDDGFGPAVIEELQKNYRLPPDVKAEDVGTSIREVLFDIALSEKRPDHLILVDTIHKEGKKHGDVFELNVADLTEKKVADYSMHQFPTSNLLREIAELCGVRVTILAAQQTEPSGALTMELSETMQQAVFLAARKAYELSLAPAD
jgi:coenzyme F420 hydrogenase subunit delta